MNLSKAIPPDPPRLDQGGIGGNEKKPTVDTDSELWKQQQAMLARLRLKLCDLVQQKRNGVKCDEQIASTFSLLSSHIHVAEWKELLPVFDAINGLGTDYQKAIVIFGGWHHSGDLGNINPPAKNLLLLLREYRGLLRTASACVDLQNGGREKWKITQTRLRELLKEYQHTLPESMWQQPQELLALIQQRKPMTTAEIETALLFLESRVFVFNQITGKPCDGWIDFRRFVFAYRRLVDNFASDFCDYYWGIYPARSAKLMRNSQERGNTRQ